MINKNMFTPSGVYMKNNFMHPIHKIISNSAGFLTVLTFSLMLLHCSTAVKKEQLCPDENTDPVTYRIDERGKFCDEDTYIIKSTGIPSKKLKTIKERRNSSRNAAVLLARYKIIETFTGYKIETFSPLYDLPEEYIKGQALWKKDMEAIVKSGRVLCESFDSEQNCTILYIVHKKGLATFIDILVEEYTGSRE